MISSVELRQNINSLVTRAKEIVDLCKTEVREMSEDEEKEYCSIREQIDEKKEELKALEEKLEEYEKDLPEEVEEKEEDEKETEKNNKRSNQMKKNTFISELRKAVNEGARSMTMNVENRAITVTGDAGIHDEVVETKIQSILEPLYAESVLSKLGARWYTGLPMGDIQVPIMGKGTAGFVGEIDPAVATGNAFTTKKLQPKRLSAYLDISKQMLAQDTIGVEQALLRDMGNALQDAFEATVLGTADKTDNKPAGIFYNASYTEIPNYTALCEFEAALDNANIPGNRKYLMGNTARADLRSMIRGTNNTGMVMEGNSVDGTPALWTSNVAGGALNADKLVYGDFSALALASWGDVELTFDYVTKAVEGCVRIVINCYVDAVVLRPEAFAFAQITAGE